MQRLGEAGGSRGAGSRADGESAPTKFRPGGTARRPRAGKRDRKAERERTGGRSPLSYETAPNLADMGRGQQTASSYVWAIRSDLGQSQAGVGDHGELRVLRGCAAGVEPAADPVKRIMVNVG